MPRTCSVPRRSCRLRRPLPGRRDDLDPGNADPAERIASAGPQTGPPIPAPARASGDESRQPDPELHEVFHGAAKVLLRQGGLRTPREAADHAAQGAARAGAEGLRLVRVEAGRLGRSARHARLAVPAEDEEPTASTRRSPTCRQMRPLAKALKVRFRAEVALGRFDDALSTAKTMFAMSRHLGAAPDVRRRPGGYRDRGHGHRPPGGDAGTAGLPQPLLGADEPTRPSGPHRQGHGRRARGDHRRSSATWTTAPR